MSIQSATQSLTNETREAFDFILKVAVTKPKEDIKCENASNDNLSIISGNESNKSFLLKKFFQTSNDELISTGEEIILKAPRPIPKPRKSKTKAPQERPNHIESPSSQKTYIVENENKVNNIGNVEVIIHNDPKSKSSGKSSSSKNGSSDLGRTYVKSINETPRHSQDVNTVLTKNKANSDNEISKVESEVTSEKSDKTKDIENNMDIKTNYKYDKIVEIIIHKADALQLDSYVTHPTVKVHIVDTNTGKYYLKSSKGRSVVFYYENEDQDYILPVMTSSYNLQEKRTFSPEWEESILLNEDFNYLINENVVLFFEVLDYIPYVSKNFDALQKHCYKGWHRITFAFLKPLGKDQSLNVNKKVKLQLYYPKETKNRNLSECDLWQLWKADKLKTYPSALYVTVKELISPKKVVETFRSKTPLQIENISNLKGRKRNFQSIETTSEKEARSNCSKTTYELPNKPLAELDSCDNGCFVLKFSHSGSYLACAVQVKETFILIVYEVNSLEETHCINEHMGLIYSISWSSNDKLVLTASADNTVVIWNFSTNSFLQILPHPIYVYTTQISSDDTFVATGCYDTIVRMWLFNEEEGKYKLHQELENHKGYVTSVCFNNKSIHLYSSDSTGTVIEWLKLDNSDWQFQSGIYGEYNRFLTSREISVPDLKNTIINEILLFPNQKKILVHSRDSILRIISIKRACVLYWLQGALNLRVQTFCSITSCGKYVTAGSENGLVVVWDAKTGKDILTYEPFLNHLPLETVHCAMFNPKDNLIAFSHYGSVSPILLYQNTTRGEKRHERTFHSDKVSINESNETFPKENISFHDVLLKMDKLLN